MDICIRGINPRTAKALDEIAAKKGVSREEYLRRCIERIAYDERAMEGRYAHQLQKLVSCIQVQQEQLSGISGQLTELMDSNIRLEDAVLPQEEDQELFGYPEEEEEEDNG